MPKKYKLQLQRRWTDDVNELVVETEYITKVLATFGLKPTGFDPGVRVSDTKDPYGRGNASQFDIPIWFFRRLEAAAQLINEMSSDGAGGYYISARDYFDPVAAFAKLTEGENQ